MKRTFLINSQKGQALVELATFGTILLFCLGMLVSFGLQANYQQETEMKAFRQSMQQSYNSTRGPSAGAEVNLTEDKVGIDTQSPYGVSERYPFTAGAKVTWNTNLLDDYVDQDNNLHDGNGAADYHPKATYTINGKEYAYTTANFVSYPCNGSITVRVPDRNDEYSMDGTQKADGKYWRDVNVDCGTQTKIFKDESDKDHPFLAGYVKIDGVKEQIGSADVDHDGKQELVVKVEGNEKGPIQRFVVLDSQEGEIDATVEIPLKPDGSQDIAEYAKRQQGLLPGYTKEIYKKGKLTKEETKTSIVTTSTAKPEENYEATTRTIKLNKFIGPPAPIKENLPNVDGKEIKWISPK